MNTEWANSLLNIIPTVPFAWFGVSLLVWVVVAFILYQYSQYLQRKSTGVTTVKIRFDKKVFVDKVLHQCLEVLRCLHFLGWTRGHLTMTWLILFLILSEFGPRRATATLRAGLRTHLHQSADV